MRYIAANIALLLSIICTVPALYAGENAPKLQNKIKCPVVLVAFEDTGFTIQNPRQSFNSMLNARGYSANGATGSAADYLNANFYGKCTFEFEVSDVITLPYHIAEFGAPSGTFNDSDVKRLVYEACSTASAGGFDFSSCDTDADGTIENVAVIFAGHAESEGGAPETIWSHQQSLTDNPLSFNGVKIMSYSITPELKGGEGNTISPIGTFCHEFLHSMGLPDMYDTNGELEGLSPAMYGSLSIMDNGHFLNGGKTPPYLNAIEREILGISEVVELEPDTYCTLPPIYRADTLYRISTSVEGEYFLLEYRDGTKWDRYIGGKGLVVYHLDKSGNVYGGMASSSRWQYNNINCYAPHECAKVIPAAPAHTELGALFFPGSSDVRELLSENGYSQLKEWNGYAVGIGIEEIMISNGNLVFKTIMDYSFNGTLPVAAGCKATPYQRDAKISWNATGQGDLPAETKMQWLISWMREDDKNLHEAILDSTSCHLYGLEPGNTYNVRIRSLLDKEFGESVTFDISTAPITSAYPYIYLSGERYGIGDRLDLRVYNLVEEYSSIAWYINGEKLDEEYFIIDEEGYLEIELVIEYKDGSSEKIYKEIHIG